MKVAGISAAFPPKVNRSGGGGCCGNGERFAGWGAGRAANATMSTNKGTANARSPRFMSPSVRSHTLGGEYTKLGLGSQISSASGNTVARRFCMWDCRFISIADHFDCQRVELSILGRLNAE